MIQDSEHKFVQELPTQPEAGDVVYLSLGREGFWSQQTFDGTHWFETGGIACPYIPEFMKESS